MHLHSAAATALILALLVLNDGSSYVTSTTTSFNVGEECGTAGSGIALEEAKKFRVYDESNSRNALVLNHYTLMRKHQTMEYVERMNKIWTPLNKGELSLEEIFELLKDYVDSSDPDFGLPNVIHNFQTAEAIRADHHPDWMQLVGLLHDVGKMQFVWGNDADGQSGKGDGQQFALGGDTWIVGCRIPDSVVHPQLNALNPDMQDPRYNSTLGIYKEKIGLNNVLWAWGHDEYMYRVLENTKIPPEGLAMIRFHSAYPWHDKREYQLLETEEDKKFLPWIKLFNKYDLYEKKKTPPPDVKKLMPYYQELFNKYIPGGKLKF